VKKSNQVFPGNAKKFQEMATWCRQNLGRSHGPQSSWHVVKRNMGIYWPGRDYMKGIEFRDDQIAFWAKMTWE